MLPVIWTDDDAESDLDELNDDSDSEDTVDADEEIADAIDNELSEAEDEDALAPVQRYRKPLTWKRKVKSIYAALNIDNYSEATYLNFSGEWEDLTGYLGPKKNPATEKII